MSLETAATEDRSTTGVWLLAVVVAMVPIITANLTAVGIGRQPLLYDAVELPRFVLTTLGALLACTVWLLACARAGANLRIDRTLWLLAALSGWAALSSVFSTHRALSLLGQSERLGGFATVLGYLLLYLVTLQVVRGARDVRVVVTGVAVAATFSAVYGFLQFVGFDPTNHAIENLTFSTRRAFATFGNPDFLAGFLVLAVPAVFGLALSSRRPWSLIWGLAGVASSATLFATATRAGWIAGIVEAVIALAILLRRGGRLGGAWPWLALGTGALITAMALSPSIHGQSLVGERVADAASSGGSVTQRIDILDSAVAAAEARPLFGYGPATFLAAYRLHRSTALDAQLGPAFTVNNAHSWPLQYAATLGILGGIFLTCAVVSALWAPGSAAFSRQRSESSALISGVWLGCLGYSLFMLTSVGIHGATTPFWVLAGALGATAQSKTRITPTTRLTPRLASLLAGVACVLTALAFFGTASMVRADAAYLQSRMIFHGDASGDAAAQAALAMRFNPLSIKYARGAAEIQIYATRQAIEADAPPNKVRRLLAGAESALSRALAVDTNDYPTLAWKAGMEAEAASYLRSRSLSAEAMATAKRAEHLDRDPIQVANIASGSMSLKAVQLAESVQPLP